MRKIETMYQDVKQDVEANTPDGFTSVMAAKKMVAGFGFGGEQAPHGPPGQQQQSIMTAHAANTAPALEAGQIPAPQPL